LSIFILSTTTDGIRTPTSSMLKINRWDYDWSSVLTNNLATKWSHTPIKTHFEIHLWKMNWFICGRRIDLINSNFWFTTLPFKRFWLETSRNPVGPFRAVRPEKSYTGARNFVRECPNISMQCLRIIFNAWISNMKMEKSF
jgi:hypothetical protein